MLSGEGNVGERWKTTIGLIRKKKQQLIARAAHFFVHFFAVISLKLLRRYTLFGGNVVRVLVHFFFTAAHFHLALGAASISHFVTAATKFSCCPSNKKKCLLCFFNLPLLISVALFLVELRWPAADFLLFSDFLLLYIPNLWTWQSI